MGPFGPAMPPTDAPTLLRTPQMPMDGMSPQMPFEPMVPPGGPEMGGDPSGGAPIANGGLLAPQNEFEHMAVQELLMQLRNGGGAPPMAPGGPPMGAAPEMGGSHPFDAMPQLPSDYPSVRDPSAYGRPRLTE